MNVNSNYSICERILRANVFQLSVYGAGDAVADFLIYLFQAATQRTLCPQPILDKSRASRGEKYWDRLGATFKYLVPKDEQAKIYTMHVRSSDIEAKITELGGSWKRARTKEGKEIFAVFAPEDSSQEWNDYEADLIKLKWQKRDVILEDDTCQELIVTCEDASSIKDENCHQRLFMHVNSPGVSFIMLRQRAGFYLGCKQDIFFYDPRGSWKSMGIASEAGFYNDAEAAYEAISPKYEPEYICISSICGGNGPAAYLLSQTHDKGHTFIRENGYTSLRKDFVEPQPFLARRFALRYWSGLSSRDIPDDKKPDETGFEADKLWNDLEKTPSGKVMIVYPSNDQLLSPDVAKRHVVGVQKIFEDVLDLPYVAPGPDPHNTQYIDSDSKATSEVLKHLFATK